MDEKPPQRVAAYVAGFNLYFGLRDSNFRKFLWLDLLALTERLILPNQRIVSAKYFTARISGGKPADSQAYREKQDASRKRQAIYLDALATITGIQAFEGQFLAKTVECRRCGAAWSAYEEKMTDVNIATELLVDAFANRYDTALLVSADSDLVPPVRAVRTCFPHKRVVVAFPPGRASKELKDAASAQFIISKGVLKKSQLPEQVQTASGFVLKRPEEWS